MQTRYFYIVCTVGHNGKSFPITVFFKNNKMFNREAIENDVRKSFIQSITDKFVNKNIPETVFKEKCDVVVTFWKELDYADWNEFTKKAKPQDNA